MTTLHHKPASSATEELWPLVEAVCAGTITAQQCERLNALLLGDEEAALFYATYLQMHGCLAWRVRDGLAPPVEEQAATALPAARPLPPPIVLGSTTTGAINYLSSGWPVAYLVATMIVGIGLWVGSLLHVSPTQPIAGRPSAPGPAHAQPALEPVGRITGMVDCKWVQSPETRVQSPALDSRLSTLVSLGDKFALSSGLLEIAYDSGAKVVLEGPVTYEVESKDGGFLSLGKLTAEVQKPEIRNPKSETISKSPNLQISKSAIPHPSSLIPHPLFSVRTPTATITDLGTEFGVEVSKDGNTTSHVFRGSVKLQWASADGVGETPARILRENESARVERDAAGRVAIVAGGQISPASFVRAEQLPQLVRGQQEKPFRQWQAYADRLRHDPALVAYYDFQRRDDSPAVLHALGNGAADARDGAIDGAVWTTGRMTGKQALHFDGEQARVKVSLPQRMTQMTLAAWVAIEFVSDNRESGSAGLLMSDGWHLVENAAEKCHWQLLRTGEICLSTVAGGKRTTSPILPWQEWGRGRWRHLAVVADPAHQQVTCYLDGKSVFQGALNGDFRVCFGKAQIGNWQPMAGLKERAFCGRIDELVVLARAMSSQEIAEMCQAGGKTSVEVAP